MLNFFLFSYLLCAFVSATEDHKEKHSGIREFGAPQFSNSENGKL